MKVGTDAVLLGAWVSINHAKSILDIGTGSGVIALMLAQRSNALIDAVEPDKNSAEQAAVNFRSSPWSNRLRVYNLPIQDFEYSHYDLIVSNPPFFSNSLLPPNASRQAARHTETLSFDDLILATKHGRLAVILPATEGNLFREKAREQGLHCNRSLAFYSRRDKPQERWLMEFSQNPGEITTEKLVLYEEKDRWTKEYALLVKDFLTKVYT
jgi:tRNA1Val (adenine37-N6)-methyltransferase